MTTKRDVSILDERIGRQINGWKDGRYQKNIMLKAAEIYMAQGAISMKLL